MALWAFAERNNKEQMIFDASVTGKIENKNDLSSMENFNYRLDRTAFKALSYKEADKQINDSRGLSQEERFNQFNYFMSVAYQFLGKQWPCMDRTYFEKIKRS